MNKPFAIVLSKCFISGRLIGSFTPGYLTDTSKLNSIQTERTPLPLQNKNKKKTKPLSQKRKRLGLDIWDVWLAKLGKKILSILSDLSIAGKYACRKNLGLPEYAFFHELRSHYERNSGSCSCLLKCISTCDILLCCVLIDEIIFNNLTILDEFLNFISLTPPQKKRLIFSLACLCVCFLGSYNFFYDIQHFVPFKKFQNWNIFQDILRNLYFSCSPTHLSPSADIAGFGPCNSWKKVIRNQWS